MVGCAPGPDVWLYDHVNSGGGGLVVFVFTYEILYSVVCICMQF